MITGYQGHLQAVSLSFLLSVAGVLLLKPISSEGAVQTPQELGKNPHGDSERCDVCHVSVVEEPTALLFDGDVMALCQSCHDGTKASREVHPLAVSVKSMAEHWPSEFPLQEGRMTCLTCHDMAKACQGDATHSAHLRGTMARHRMEFCAHCHDAQKTKPFNVHDQKGTDGLKTETCLWCHVGSWDTETPGYENPVYLLRPYGGGLCENCHTVAADHPSGGPHMNALPPEEMIWYMAANEMQDKMRLPFKDLLSFVKAAKRLPRTLPLNAQSRMTCYTCHNPHETGVIRASNPRALGAEGKQARNYRLRGTKKGQMCQACHNK